MNGSVAADGVGSRNLVLLTDDNRFVRKNAMKSLKEELLTIGTDGSNRDKFIQEFASRVPLILSDSVEVNRESAVELVDLFVKNSPDLSISLPHLFAAFVQRLGQKEIIETSEEIRLAVLKILSSLLDTGTELSPYVDDIIIVLQRTFADNYPEMKKLSCKILSQLAMKKYHRFYQTSESVLSPLLTNITHQHSKVRVEVINAVGVFMMFSQGKLVDTVIPPFTQRLFDSSPQVRRCIIEVVGNWLLDLPDRYSYHTRLLPLILSGFADDSDEIRSVTEELWYDIGLKFEKENDEQLKDKSDFDQGTPYHYPVGCRRPNLGCRELVYRSASRLLPALCRDLGDWQEATRSKAACLIPILILHLEGSATQHVQQLLTGLATGLSDAIGRIAPTTSSIALLHLLPPVRFRGEPVPKEDKSINSAERLTLVPKIPPITISGCTEMVEAVKVVKQLLLSAQLLGCVTHAQLWWHLLESCLKRCTESAAPTSLAGHLFLLAGLISGTSTFELNWADNALGSQIQNQQPQEQQQQQQQEEDKKPTPSDNPKPILSPIHQILLYLIQNDILSVVSFSAKASLYECVTVLIRRLEESVICSCTNFDPLANEVGLSDTQRQIAEDAKTKGLEAARCLLANFQFRSWLFQILMAISAIWVDEDSKLSDFGRDILDLTDSALKRLAACERDLALHLNGQPIVEVKPIPELPDPLGHLLQIPQPKDLDRLFARHMFTLFERLDKELQHSGSWHPHSPGLFMFSRCLYLAGPALLLNPPTLSPSQSIPEEAQHQPDYLTMVLDLLERGCRLNIPPGTDTHKEPGGCDPLTMASEAELRLRGLIVLTRLTDNGPVRTALASPNYLNRCLSKLVLPVCVWRAGRTAEAMRKAALTSLVALLAAATSVYDLEEMRVDSRSPWELKIDHWLCEHVESVRQLVGPKAVEVTQESLNTKSPTQTSRTSSLPTLDASMLSLILARLGSLLDDDLEPTRRMSCLGLTLLFNGLLINPRPPKIQLNDSSCGDVEACDFLNSPTWLQPIGDDENGRKDLPKPVPYSPYPKSFGDQVYRFYPNLVKRLNDPKDQIRLLVSETINSWLRLLMPMLTANPDQPDPKLVDKPIMNPVHSAVIEDCLNQILIHLDDPDPKIRSAMARIVGRFGFLTPNQVRPKLEQAQTCFRSAQLCNQLLQLVFELQRL